MESFEDSLAHRLRERFHAARFMGFIGVALRDIERGRAATRLDTRSELTRADGSVHPGVFATMADHTAEVAASTLVDEHVSISVTSFTITVLRPAMVQAIECVSEAHEPGPRIMEVECEIYGLGDDGSRTLLAKAVVHLQAGPAAGL